MAASNGWKNQIEGHDPFRQSARFRFARTSLLSLTGWQELNPARINLIVDFLRTEIQSTFGGV